MDEGDDATPFRRDRVLIVDDQVSVREMVAMLVDRQSGLAVSAEATTGLEGLRMFRRHRPHLVIAALALPEMNGAEMIHAMREELPAARVLIYTGTRNGELIAAGLAARAHGFVHKTEPLGLLRQGLEALTRGSSFFSPFATRAIDARPASAPAAGGLSSRDRLVLQFVAEGLSTKQMAARISLAPKTVERYRIQLMEKLGLRDVASLTRYAVRCGLVE